MDDPTFPYRVAFGLVVFAVLGVIDWIRNRQDPRRLKEYGFLFSVTGATMAYGLLHDAVTFALSPDFFRLVKGMASESFFPEVAQLALMAAWSAGLTVGLAMLVANNPSKRLPQLPYRRLARHLGWPLGGSLLMATSLGLISRLIPLPWYDGTAVAGHLEVATVWAVHVGTYVGAVAGLLLAVVQIRRERRKPAGGRSCRVYDA